MGKDEYRIMNVEGRKSAVLIRNPKFAIEWFRSSKSEKTQPSGLYCCLPGSFTFFKSLVLFAQLLFFALNCVYFLRAFFGVGSYIFHSGILGRWFIGYVGNPLFVGPSIEPLGTKVGSTRYGNKKGEREFIIFTGASLDFYWNKRFSKTSFIILI